jgi:hypothetical protein
MKIARILFDGVVGCLITASTSAMGFCVVENNGCRDLETGKLYVQEGDQLVDPETKQIYSEIRSVEPIPKENTTSRTLEAPPANPASYPDIFGFYQTASASGKLFHGMDISPESNGRVRIRLLIGLTTTEVRGCYGGAAIGSSKIAPDNSVSFSSSDGGASFTSDKNSACRVKVKFDLDWGAADVMETNCQKVHGPNCSFAGRYLRFQR